MFGLMHFFLTRFQDKTRHASQEVDGYLSTEDGSLGPRLLVRDRSDEHSVLGDVLRGVVLNWNGVK